ncbi:hypothetical protein JCM8547_007003 [Rhodosporidiobolus lusitaniae]
MEFSNGFIEDDNPTLSPGPSPPPPLPSLSRPSASTSTTNNNTLDLTSDSPPPIHQQLPYRPRPPPPATSALDQWFAQDNSAAASSSAQPAGGSSSGALYGRGGHAYGAPGGSGSGCSADRGLASLPLSTSSSAQQQQQHQQQFNAFLHSSYGSAVAGAPSGSSASARQTTGGAAHQHPLASLGAASRPTSFAAYAGNGGGGFEGFGTTGGGGLGRIPVIGSASAARVPSSFLPSRTSASASTSSSGYAFPPPSIPSTSSSSAAKGKSRAAPPPPSTSNGVLDLTSDASDDDLQIISEKSPDLLIVDPPPVCIGTLSTRALMVDPFFPLVPPKPPQTVDLFNRALSETEKERDQHRFLRQVRDYRTLEGQGKEVRVRLRREGKMADGEHEMVRLYAEVEVDSPPAPLLAGSEQKKRTKWRPFGFLDKGVADVLAPWLGERGAASFPSPVRGGGGGFLGGTGGQEMGRWHGTGVSKEEREGKWDEGEGRLRILASVVRGAEMNPCMLPLRLHLFCLPSTIPHLSTTLELAQPPIYLSHPCTPPPTTVSGLLYSNPHNPSEGVLSSRTGGGGGSGGGSWEGRRKALADGLAGQGAYGRQVVKQVDVQREQVEEVFRELKSGIDLEEVEPPPIVATPLYPHQKQALSFLLDRESVVPIPPTDPPGGPPTIVSLWKREMNLMGTRTIGWKSLVSDLRMEGERGPPQARGAILADDMGLGKTIVVISLVCTTLPDARKWALNPPTMDKLDSRLEDQNPSQSSTSSSVAASSFSSNLYGLGGASTSSAFEPAAPAGKMSKKKAAKQRKEKAKDELLRARFGRLKCRSRATLIVCPLSTVQNWESQFGEHTRAVDLEDGGAEGERAFRVEIEEEMEEKKGEKGGKKRKRAAGKVEDSEEDGEGGPSAGTTSASASDGEDVKPKKASKSSSSSSRKPALSIYIYHGNSRLSSPHKLADFDVVITTFSTLGAEYSKQQRAEEEREDEEEREKKKREEEEEGVMEVYGFGPDGEVLTRPPVLEGEEEGAGKGKKGKGTRKRKRVEGSGVSPLQAVQWFRVVLDEAHIIKEHKTIQARAACDLSTSRRIALTGTPLQNSLNDIFSLLRFIRLEPFTERHHWTHFIGGPAQKDEDLGIHRLKLIMRHLALRRTKDTKGADGKPILALPPMTSQIVELEFSEQERAFYTSHHSRYKDEFHKLEETDSVMKNMCSILQELLKLRQICVHPALLQDSEDRAAGSADLAEVIRTKGISKPRAVQLVALFRDSGAGDCAECGNSLAAFGRANVEELDSGEGGDDGDEKKPKKPAAKKRKTAPKTTTAATSSNVKFEDDLSVSASATDSPALGEGETSSCIVTRCQHLFCRPCFMQHMAPSWPAVKSGAMTLCKVCSSEVQPALDAVEVGAGEFQRAVERGVEEDRKKVGKKEKEGKEVKGKKKETRLFEHSTKTRALLLDLLPFSQANPSSPNYDPLFDPKQLLDAEGKGGTHGFQPVNGEVVKSVVFSQWTALLDRLGDALEQEHIRYRRLDGSMSREARADSMEAFKTDPKTEVLLVSLRAGGVGLNLTAGRRVYLMEPFWNPAVENQAIDRIYRLGQTKEVACIRFVMHPSIESNMLKIQKRKMALAQMSVGRTLSKAELAKQRQEDLRQLLSYEEEETKPDAKEERQAVQDIVVGGGH